MLPERRGLILRLEETSGRTGWGEAAPLEGFSRETLEEATEAARIVLPDLTDLAVASGTWLDVFSRSPSPSVPSVAFALESAILELMAQVRGQSVRDILGGGPSSVTLNALLDETDDVEETIQRLVGAGYHTVKLKVGRQDLAVDVDVVRRICSAADGRVDLRLDANRAWTLQEALAFSEQVETSSISYVEEPLQNPDELAAYVSRSGWPIALDETTREWSPKRLREGMSVRAVILKPSLLGGIGDTYEWVRIASEEGVVPVLSASYESGVGLRMLGAIAAAWTDVPAGLSTYATLEDDLLRPRPSTSGPVLNVDEFYDGRVRTSCLQTVEFCT